MATIPESWGKIKAKTDSFIGDWGLYIIIFLLALSAFGLGRLSVTESAHRPVHILQAAASEEPRAMPLGGEVVASRTGTSYHYPWCAGAAQIAPANQVWFKSIEAARKAGYQPAKNCKGLE